MKHIVVVVVGTVVAASWCAGCDVCDGADGIDGTLILREQSDVDAFPDGKCVRGDLVVGEDLAGGNTRGAPNDTIVDLGPLASLEVVEGTLAIRGNNALAKVSLPALTFAGRRLLDPDPNSGVVRGGFFLRDNPVLTSVELPALTDVGGCFEIEDNTALDPAVADDLFAKVHSHAFPGSCNGAIEINSGNGGGA